MLPQESQNKSLQNKIESIARNYTNIAIIVIVSLIQIFWGMLSFDGGINYDKYSHYLILDWILFGVNIVIKSTIGVLINIAFRQQGILIGKRNPDVKKAHDEYLSKFNIDTEIKIRSENKYKREQALKDLTIKTIIGILTAIIITELTLNGNFEAIIGTFIVLALWVVFGLYEMMKSIIYCEEELIIWYKQEINKIENEKEKENNGI